MKSVVWLLSVESLLRTDTDKEVVGAGPTVLRNHLDARPKGNIWS